MDQGLRIAECRLAGRHCVWLWIALLFDQCMSGMLCATVSVCRWTCAVIHTLEYALHFGHLCRIVKFPKLFGLLRQFLPLYKGIALVSYEVGSGIVEGRDERGKVDVYSTLSVHNAQSDAIMPFVLLHAEIALWNLFSSAFSGLVPSVFPSSTASSSLTVSGVGSAMSAMSMAGELRPRDGRC